MIVTMVSNPAKELESVSPDQDRVAVVVGGTQGIGAAIAKRLGELACRRVIIAGRSREAAMRTKVEVESASQGHTTVDFVQVDLTSVGVGYEPA